MTVNVLQYLEQTALRFPKRIACEDERQQYSYWDLKEMSLSVGSALSHIIRPREPVAVYMEKSGLNLAVFYGIVYAGGFYVSLNTELPESRLRQIQSVLQARCIITDWDGLDTVRHFFSDDQILLAEDLLASPLENEKLRAVRASALDTDPLYANFTSGSTGIPKGVLVSHRSVIDFIDCFTELFQLTEEDRIANQAPFDFDVSVKDIYSALKTGATLVIVPRKMFSQPRKLVDYLCERQVTTMIWAVSALCLITTFHGLDYRIPTSVQKVLFSGEVMPYKHLKQWMEHLPDAQFVNLYGPTEITCNCTYHILDRARGYENGIPIGRHFPNEEVFLLDDQNQEIREPGIIGELCVRGTALALGYYRAPQQTADAFVPDPRNNAYPERIYRTGDLAQYSPEGELFYRGRKDFQIKYMGHRIELEEIERLVSCVPQVERCCCVYDEKKQKIYGFYMGALDQKELHRQLKENLPGYMVPSSLKQVDEIPLTKNGKIDRKKLWKGGGNDV